MNTATTTSTAIHRSELARCGCRVDTQTGARFTTCPAHSNLPAVDPLAKKGVLRPLCPVCSSQHLKPIGINILCRDCDALFAAADITSYGLSDDGGPRKCDCGVVHYGLTATCFRCTQQEVA